MQQLIEGKNRIYTQKEVEYIKQKYHIGTKVKLIKMYDELYKIPTGTEGIIESIDDIKIGNAEILTVLEDDKVEKFDIKILSIKNTKDKLKNIEIEVTDKKLLDKTNGVVQGMSGSPIIQGEYIVGAITHVVVEDPHRGYGILIENMLEEAEN